MRPALHDTDDIRPESRHPSPLLRLANAVPDTGQDAGTAWHYGDPIGEQRAAARGAILVDLSHLETVTVAGPDRLTWLHTLTTQHLSERVDGELTEALILSAQGHVEHQMLVTEIGEVTYLTVEPGAAAGLLGFLDSMRFWSKVELADATDGLARVRLIGPRADEVASTVAGTAVPAPGTAIGLEDGRRLEARDVGLAGPVVDIVLPRTDLPAAATDLMTAGAQPAGSWAAAALRIPTRRPRWGVDSDDRTIPNETAWLDSAVHLQKGCYRGQETVARVHNLGRPPRRLAVLNLDGSADHLPEPGDPVTLANGRAVGRVGTVAHHHESGPIALALIKRGLDSRTAVLAGGVDAALDPDDIAEPAEQRPVSAIDRRAFRELRRP